MLFRYTQFLFLSLLLYSLAYVLVRGLNLRLTEQQFLVALPLPVWVGGQQRTFSSCFSCPVHYLFHTQWPAVFEIHSDNLPKSFRSRLFEPAGLYSSSDFSNGTLKSFLWAARFARLAVPHLDLALCHQEHLEFPLYWCLTPVASKQYRICELTLAHTHKVPFLFGIG